MKLQNCHPHMSYPHIIQEASRSGPNGPTKAVFFLSRHSCPLWPPQCFSWFKSKWFKSNVHVFLTVSDDIRWTSQIIPDACKGLDVYPTSTICRSFLGGNPWGKTQMPSARWFVFCRTRISTTPAWGPRGGPVAAGYRDVMMWSSFGDGWNILESHRNDDFGKFFFWKYV